MKKTFVFMLLTMLAFAANAQLNIGAPGAIKPSTFKKSEMELFQSSTTYFVMRQSDKPDQAKIENVLNEVWKFNKIKVIDFVQYKSIAHQENSIFFGLRSYNYNSNYVSNADLYGKYTSYTKVYIQLWRNLEVKKEGELEEQIIARLQTPFPWGSSDQLKEKNSFDAFEYLCYSDAKVSLWNLGVLKNYLQVINQCMIGNKTRWVFQSDVDKEQIKNLKKETLYVDAEALLHRDSREKEPAIKSYTYKYETIKMEDLGKKILESEKPFYYMVAYFQGTDKITTVVNSKTGEFIYSDYKGQSNFFKGKDLENLVNKIDK